MMFPLTFFTVLVCAIPFSFHVYNLLNGQFNFVAVFWLYAAILLSCCVVLIESLFYLHL